MGKKQHQSDKLYLTTKEWKHEWGGRKDAVLQQLSRLPFHCCALSLSPFIDAVATPDGTIFELLNIVPYIKEHGTNPVTGQPLTIKQLTKLTFHKSPSGEYHCPITFKVFNEHSHIVGVRTSGNVYSYEAFEQLNLKPKNFTDLMSGEKFTRADVLTIQDPTDWSRRQIDLFEHVRRKRAAIDDGSVPASAAAALAPATGADAVNSNPHTAAAQSIIASMSSSSSSSSSSYAAATAAAVASSDTFTGKRLPKRADDTDEKDAKRAKPAPVQLAPARAHFTTGAAAASFTSTAQVLVTANQSRLLDDEEVRERRYTNMRRAAATRKGRDDTTSAAKAFVRLRTSAGALNLRLDCDLAPRTCHNFLTLCERGYYNGTKFHRLIAGFMLQGGDPTGTGRGGACAWGGKNMRDEFHERLRHDERGVLSMANAGADTNGSQFFITFGPTPHLDNKHSVFGRLVGGADVLAAIERTPTDDGDRPRTDLVIEETTVYKNPFAEPDEEEAKELRRLELERLDAAPVKETYGASGISISGQEVHRAGVGKYISAAAMQSVAAAAATKAAAEKAAADRAVAAAAAASAPGAASDASKKRFSFKSF